MTSVCHADKKDPYSYRPLENIPYSPLKPGYWEHLSQSMNQADLSNLEYCLGQLQARHRVFA